MSVTKCATHHRNFVQSLACPIVNGSFDHSIPGPPSIHDGAIKVTLTDLRVLRNSLLLLLKHCNIHLDSGRYSRTEFISVGRRGAADASALIKGYPTFVFHMSRLL